MDYRRVGYRQSPLRPMGSPDGLGAYFATSYQQPIRPVQGGASTVAQYHPIQGLGMSPLPPWATQRNLILGALALAGVAYFAMRKGKPMKANGRGRRRHRRNAAQRRNGAPYRWVITKDYVTDAVGVSGPRGRDPTLNTNRAHFVMKDDDGETYYEGDIYGEYSGFEPLDDFGEPNAGATSIFYGGKRL